MLALIGVRGAEQSRVLDRFWTAFAGAMATEDELDILADCGRLGPDSPAMSVVTKAHMTLLLTRPDVEGVVQAQLRATALQEAGVEPERLAVVVVGKDPYGEAEVAEALDIPVIGTMARDPRTAATLSGQKAGRRSRMSWSPLMRSSRILCHRLQEVVLPLPVVSAGWRREDNDEVPAHVMALGVDRDE